MQAILVISRIAEVLGIVVGLYVMGRLVSEFTYLINVLVVIKNEVVIHNQQHANGSKKLYKSKKK